MNETYTYDQPIKSKVRHLCLAHAIELLTFKRNSACCVERNYVRKVYDYFMEQDDSPAKRETSKIDPSYIINWERHHDACIGFKRPEDLVVCYLSGPEPQNDFKELIALGILPQNIWAFENHNSTYSTALKACLEDGFPQPKIVNIAVENFFKNTPKRFDIVYIDACGAVPSDQHSMRIVSSLMKYHRLNSPGAIISNFSKPDIGKATIYSQYTDLISHYLWTKQHCNNAIKYENNEEVSDELEQIKHLVGNNFNLYYGEFISSIIRDICSIIAPIYRFSNSEIIKNIAKINAKQSFSMNLNDINNIENNSIYKFLGYSDWRLKLSSETPKNKKYSSLINEMIGIDPNPVDLLKSFYIMILLQQQ